MVIAFQILLSSCGIESIEPVNESTLEQAITPDCSPTDIQELTATPTSETQTYVLGCNAFLSSSVTIRKRIIISSSYVTLSCADATIDNRGFPWYDENLDAIEIASTYNALSDTWTRPHDVNVSRCHVEGSVRIYGMCMNGQDCEAQRISSASPGHTQRARDRAPTNITLDNMRITANHRTPVYFGPGVTYSSLTNSIIDGTGVKGDLYLDAESAYNRIKSNQFLMNTGGPVISIDGSSDNTIIDNYLSSLDMGGIYLYRNCGEAGTVRWNTPSNNTIINNVFYYNSYNGPNRSIYIGSRGGTQSYCSEDNYSPYGSGSDNRDLATGNVVAQNQIYVNPTTTMIQIGSLSGNAYSNIIDPSNTGNLSSHVVREAGCYLIDGYPNPLTLDNGTTDMRQTNGRPYCSSTPYSCNDGSFWFTTSDCTITAKSFGCTATNTNAGCSGTVACTGTGARIVGAVAACNLEYGSVSSTELNALGGNLLSVVRASDNVSDGICTVASTSRSSGTGVLSGTYNQTQVGFHCHEYDANGGDCNLAGTVYCRTQSSR